MEKEKFNNRAQNPDDDFQQLWHMSIRGIEKQDFYSEQESVADFKIETAVDWENLQRIATTPTFLEKFWARLTKVSKQRLTLINVAFIMFTPFLIMFAHRWGTPRINSPLLMEKLIGWTVFLGLNGISIIVIACPIYLLKQGNGREDGHASSTMLKSLLFGLCAILLVMTIMPTISYKNSDILFSRYSEVQIDGQSRFIAKEFERSLRKSPTKLSLGSIIQTPKDTVLDKKEAEYLNAVALKLETEGRKFEAEAVYTIMSKTDAAAQSVAFQNNFKFGFPGDKPGIAVEFLPEIGRFVAADYFPLFVEGNDHPVLDSLVRLNDSSIGSIEALNLKAIALEIMGRTEAAMKTYQYALNSRQSDIITVMNSRRLLTGLDTYQLATLVKTGDATDAALDLKRELKTSEQ